MRASLRPATPCDLDFLWQLHRATMREYVDRTWGWNEGDQAAMFREGFEPTRTQIIELDGEAIGSWTIVREPDRIRLQRIEIDPPHQSRGIGTELVRQLSRQADSDGIPIELQVLKVNPARQLYERLGFCVVEDTPTHYQMRRAPAQSYTLKS